MRLAYPRAYYQINDNPTAKFIRGEDGPSYYTYARRLGGIMGPVRRTPKSSKGKGKKKKPYGSSRRSSGRSSTKRAGSTRSHRRARVYRSPSIASTTSTALSRSVEEGGQHNDLSSTYIYYRNGRVPKKYKGVVKSCLQHQYGFQYKPAGAPTGAQWTVTIGSLVTRSQIVNAGGTSGTTTADSWPANPFELNPYATNTGSTLLQSIVSPSLDRCYLHQINGEITMTGLENIAQEVTLHLVKYRITTNNNFDTEWNTVFSGTKQFNQPASAQPVAPSTVATYGAPSVATYGQSPFGHPIMRREFKLCAVKKYTIEPGSTVKCKYRIDYNRMIHKEYFNDSATSNEFLNGWSFQWMAIIKGAPVWDSAESKMTPGPVDVGFMHTYKVKFSYPMEKRLYAYRTDAGFQTTSTAANEKIIIDTDTLTNIAQQ